MPQTFTRDVPVIVLSASDALLQESKRRGADGLLEKPFDLDALLQRVQQFSPTPQAA